MVGGAAGGAVRAGEVLAGLDQYPGESLALGGEHVGLDVVTDHQGVRGGGAQVRQCGGEERGGGLTDHLRFDAGRLFQAREERAAVELQAVASAPVHAPVHGDQPGPALEVAEGPVERLVAELRPGAADQDHIHRSQVVAGERG